MKIPGGFGLQAMALPPGFIKGIVVTFLVIVHLKTVMENNETQEAENLTWVPREIVLPEQPEKPVSKLRAGDLCPKCRAAQMDYDGLLNLTCPKCGYALGGCFT